ncbi:MAG TPA: DUF1932 domain-containing protein [Acidimicrobiales bacterium]|jgi:3-hydroxyisobutyrate dehydrogenase-like beta-hydroxyacid dehydrogenase|nr:DUF1932 domain-containing protein [Acidimicrobiales bacterium]
MDEPTAITLLHPGEMGASLGAALRRRGNRVLHVIDGRSAATCARAAAAGLEPVRTLAGALAQSAVVLSVCPPDAAVAVAHDVAATGFRGLYVDANAVAPTTAARIAEIVEGAGAAFVDGDVIGGPVASGSGTRVYLSGATAATFAACFPSGDPDVRVLGAHPTAASTLKMCYAAWTKGSSALLLAVVAAASAGGVADALYEEWRRSQPDVLDRLERGVRNHPRKAWRFAGEFDEIAETFTATGLPDGFARAAAEVSRRMAAFKDGPPPVLDDVIASLLAPSPRDGALR